MARVRPPGHRIVPPLRTGAAARRTLPPGPVLFARYAFGPNRLGYCGSDAVDELFGEVTAGHDDRALRELARSFEGAWPYLELIARANGLPDPLDRRVVEAYWLGNSLLDGVGPRRLGDSLETRFRPRLRAERLALAGRQARGRRRPGPRLPRPRRLPARRPAAHGSTDGALAVMDSCRIRWGRVLERDGDWLVVNAVPLVDDRWPARPRASSHRTDPGVARRGRLRRRDRARDVVAIHWSWACDRLSPRRLADLIGWTDTGDRGRQPDHLRAVARATARPGGGKVRRR